MPILVPFLAQQQVPMIRKVQRTVEINHVRFIDRIVVYLVLSTCGLHCNPKCVGVDRGVRSPS